MNRAALVDQIQQARDTLERQTCETAGKSGKQIERCVIATFQVAESRGTRGEFRQREAVASRWITALAILQVQLDEQYFILYTQEDFSKIASPGINGIQIQTRPRETGLLNKLAANT